MNDWILNAASEIRIAALQEASRANVLQELSHESYSIDNSLIERAAQMLELAVMECLCDKELGKKNELMRMYAADAYRLYKSLPKPSDPLNRNLFLLRLSCLAVLGDMSSDSARYLRISYSGVDQDIDLDWRSRTLNTIADIWLKLIRKNGWEDRDSVLAGVADLRGFQKNFEREYLNQIDKRDSKSAALELVALYHLAKAAEVLATYITDGVVEGNFQIKNILDMHFDRAIAVSVHSGSIQIEPLARLLSETARQLSENSIWTVTRAVNSRVTNFVRTLVDRGRGQKAIFDVLPPQRRALAEQGLLGSSRRAVVVSLPTSSGKTLIAQFRILQALNQFDQQQGWVAYLAPTRTLVRQVARRLRRDFEPLGVVVEQVSPALEIDGVEAELLRAHADGKFRVLVTTPEKLDLMLRQGWEAKIGRPLTLVVVDEAHNIQEGARGLKLELLLSTINVECQYAQFLLLTPFISNASEVAKWLGDQNSDDISLAVDWQPNDRIIGVIKLDKGEKLTGNSYSYSLSIDTVHTSRATLAIDELIKLPVDSGILKTFSQMSSASEVAASAACELSKRGPVIVMHSRPDYVWSLAEKIKLRREPSETISKNIKLVQDFLSLELGQDFPLISLLSYGIGVHHSGLSDDTRGLMEWLFENEDLDFLVATTTIAQGVNFPVSGVVMASNTHFQKGAGAVEMSAADFWNIAGRAGRVDQNTPGVVALASCDEVSAKKLRVFIDRQTGELNSSLLALVNEASDLIDDLGMIVYKKPEWSAFLQFLTHTYKQMGKPDGFVDQVEQVLRGTFGFGRLRKSDPASASRLLEGIRIYADYFSRPNQPLALVDSTGFSLQSILSAMKHARTEGIGKGAWDSDTLFVDGSDDLKKMMGVLLGIPELRENLKAATGGVGPNGDKLALILKDWVNGVSMPDIANRYFSAEGRDQVTMITLCGQSLFGKLTQTAAWGLGALLSITGDSISEKEREELNNLASRAYYGVSDDRSITLRLLGVPRMAAPGLAKHLKSMDTVSVADIRTTLRSKDMTFWSEALGPNKGSVYRRVWRVLEGLD